MKRLIALALTICLTAALTVTPAAAKEYSDTKGHWAQEAVNEITDRGYFHGTSDTTFSPNTPMTRGMFVAVLYRMASSMELPVTHGTAAKFPDVDAAAYYADAVAWASEKGIVQGGADGLFHPYDAINRQQMCAFLVRFLETCTEVDLSVYGAELGAFLDAKTVSAYAVDAMKTCCAMGLINGVAVTDGLELRPTAVSSRATVAVVLWRLVQQMENLKTGEAEQPGGAGGAGGAGGSTGSDRDEQEKLEEAQVAGYLDTMLANYRASKYLPTTDREVQECMAILMNCVEDALRQREDGTFLDKAFIRSEYAGEISELEDDYYALTEDQKNQLNNVIVRLETSEHIYTVMDYFGVNM